MGMPFGETEGGVQGKNTELTRAGTADGVNEGLFIGNLDEYIARDCAQLTDFPQNSLLVVIMLPSALDEIGSDGLSSLRCAEFNTFAESEVDQIIGKGLDVVEGELGLA